MITRPLLAATLEDIESLSYPVLCSKKLDGIRCLKIDGHVVTRNFKPLPNKYVRETLERILPNNIDGEVLLRDPKKGFNEIQSEIMRRDGEPDFVFYAFDYILTDLTTSYTVRMEDLDKWYWKYYYEQGGDKEYRVVQLQPTLVKDSADLLDFEDYCVRRGYEGVMIRDPNGHYKCGRSGVKEGILLKLKKFSDFEATIVGFEERMKNNNEKTKDAFGHSKRSSHKANLEPAGTLGALVVKDVITGLEFNIGTGFDDELRRKIWEDRENLVGKTIKYKTQLSGMKEGGLPRFPVMIGFRPEGA